VYAIISSESGLEQNMRDEVMEHYGFTKPFDEAGYYETSHHQQILKDIKRAILKRRLIAVCGVIGSGKTVTMRRLRKHLNDENHVIVAKSYALNKRRVTLDTLITALFYDLIIEKGSRIPRGEHRERELCDVVKKCEQPVALFVDDAHDLNIFTISEAKRLIEEIEDDGGSLSVVLAGHPKLGNDLRRLTMEEIGYRTKIFAMDGITGSRREYIAWLLDACTDSKVDSESILTADAVDFLASRLRTPLQIQRHLALALETSYRTGGPPVSADLLEEMLSKQFDDLEPTLVRNGYRVKDLVEQFDLKATEVKAFLNGRLDPKRTIELQDRMLAAGLPLHSSA
jgi:type II secretory pathway predicted ATPase ExeA